MAGADGDAVGGEAGDFDFGVAGDEGAEAHGVDEVIVEADFAGGAEVGGGAADGAEEDRFAERIVGGEGGGGVGEGGGGAGESWWRRKPGVM